MNITENLLGRLKYLLTVGITLLALHLSFSADLPADFKVDVIGGAHRLFRQGIDRPELEITAWSKDGVPHDLNFSFQIQDLFGHPAAATLPSLIFHVSADGSR